MMLNILETLNLEYSKRKKEYRTLLFPQRSVRFYQMSHFNLDTYYVLTSSVSEEGSLKYENDAKRL